MSIMQVDEKSVFNIARRIESREARAEYLQQICGDNPQALGRVVELLQVHEQEESFLESPAVERGSLPAWETSEQLPAERPGTQIGRYKLLEQIGEGGMGIVFVAEQTEPVRRRVALKIIKPGMDTKQVIARFEAERQALAMMDHPNIARIYDAGTTGDRDEGGRMKDEERTTDFSASAFIPHPSSFAASRPYFVMELVRGMPITEYCDKARLSPRQRLELFVAVCQAVQHAHQKGIIHRDLKPSNVMITLHDGTPVVKVIDFGVAKAVGQQLTERTIYTALTQLVGTPLYMSPEQAEMSGLDVDTRSDVYSLGVLLYELLTGQTPFDKDRLKSVGFDEMRRIIREEEPETVSQRLANTVNRRAHAAQPDKSGVDAGVNRRVHAAWLWPRRRVHAALSELDWIVMKSLEKDRSRRYESASALATDIQRYLSDEPVLACPPTTMYRFQKFARKHKPALATAAAIAACLILGTTVSAWQAARATTAEALANAKESQAQASAQKAEEKAQEAKAKAQEATQQRDEAQRQRDEVQRQRDEIKALSERLLTSQQDLQRTVYAAHMNLAQNAWDAGGVDRVTGLLSQHRPKPGERELRGFEWHYLHRLSQVNPLLTVKRQPPNIFMDRVAYSSDGTRLVGFTPGASSGVGAPFDPKLNVWDAQTGREVTTYSLTGAGRTADFSPDGKLLVSVSRDQTVKVWDIQTGREVFSIKGTGGGVAFSPDGKRLATSGGAWDETRKAYVAGNVKVWDIATVQELLNCEGHTDLVSSVAFSSDGTRLASGANDRTVKVWDAQRGREVISLKLNTDFVTDLAFSSDGTRLTCGGYLNEQDDWVGETKMWDVQTGQELLTLNNDYGSAVFSPDGKRLAARWTKARIKVWDAQSGKEILVINSGGGSPVFSPDSKRLASKSGGILRIWDLQTGEEIRTLKGVAEYGGLAFSPNGKRLVIAGYPAIQVWDVEQAQEEHKTVTFKGINRQSPSSYGTAAAVFSPDFSRLAGISYKSLKVFDARSGQEILTLQGHANNVFCVAYSPDGKYLASGDGRRQPNPDSKPVAGVVKLWDAQTGKEVRTLQGHAYSIYGVAFSPDGKRLASIAEDRAVKVWDTRTGEELLSLGASVPWTGPFASVAFSPDGKLLAGTGSRTIRVWDAQTGQEIRSFQGTGAIVFSPDAKRLAILGGRTRVFDAQSGEQLLSIAGNSFSITFSPDGKRLASPAKVWDAHTGQELLSLKGGGGSVSFSPDGHRLVCASYTGGSVTIWDATPLPEKP